MKKLSAITMFAACLLALPALADSVSISCDVISVHDQYGNNAPLGSVMACVVDTTRVGLSGLDSISPNATLAVGGGLLQTNGQTNGYIVSMWPVDYVAGYDAGDAQGSLGPDNIVETYTAGQPTTLHAGDPLYVMWFPSVIDMDAYNGNGLNTSDNANNSGPLNGLSAWGIEATLGPLGPGAHYGIFGYSDETTDPQPGGGQTYEGDFPGWQIPGGGSSTSESATTQSNGGAYSDSDPNFNAQYSTGAVPEPSTLLLLGTGFVGLLAYAWRKRR